MLKDCSPICINKFSSFYFGDQKNEAEKANNWLKNLSRQKIDNSHLVKFFDSNESNEPIVYSDHSGQWWTGRYIGSLTYEGITIEIQPRFGMNFIVKNIPLNNFIPINVNSSFYEGSNFLHLLQALLWINLLSRAAKHALPTVKKEHYYSGQVVRGKIEVRETIRAKVNNRALIVSSSTHKEIDNPITTVIVLAFQKIQRWFPSHDLLHLLPEAIAARLRQMIEITPRHTPVPNFQSIKESRLTAIARPYIPLAKLSFDILKNKGLEKENSLNNSEAFLLDVAELWEVYVLDVLKTAFSDLEVKHGTFESNTYLLSNQDGSRHLGKLLPDYIIEQNDMAISIGDAKYKRIGDAPWMSPKRDDLYQMTSYLSRFNECNVGNFYYPDWGTHSEIVKQNPWLLNSKQEINFICLPIEKELAVDVIKKYFLPFE